MPIFLRWLRFLLWKILAFAYLAYFAVPMLFEFALIRLPLAGRASAAALVAAECNGAGRTYFFLNNPRISRCKSCPGLAGFFSGTGTAGTTGGTAAVGILFCGFITFSIPPTRWMASG